MPHLELEIKLSSKSKILEFAVKLENSIQVTLFTIDGGKTWSDKDIPIETDDDLDIDMFVKMFGARDWEISIKDQLTDTVLYEDTGTTGDSGHTNLSTRTKSVKIPPTDPVLLLEGIIVQE